MVVIGNQTSDRPYVKHEIDQSVARGNGLLGIYIHNTKDVDGKSDKVCSNVHPDGYKADD